MLIFKSKHKLLVFLTIFLMAFHSLNNVFLAVIISQMIDAAVIGSMQSFLISAGIGLIGFLFFMVIGLLMVKCKTMTIKTINLSVKETMIEDIVYNSKNTEDHSADLSFMTNDLKQLETKGIEAELTIIQLAFTAVFGLVAALYYDIWITLAFFVGAVVPVILSMSFQGRIETSSKQWQQSNATYTNRLKDYFNGIETVRTYQVEDRVISKATEEADKMEDSLMKMNQTVESINQIVTTTAMIFSVIMPFGVGVYRIIQYGVTLGSFMAIVQLSNSITNPIIQIMELLNGYATTSNIRERYFIAKERTEKKLYTNDAKNIPEFSSIKLEELGLKFKEQFIFSDVDLEIQEKDKVLVIGPSGSGKSSLLRIIQQTLPISEGQYLYNGEECNNGLMQQFSLIRQQPLIFNDSIRYNITLGDDFTDEEVMEAVHLAQLDDVIAENGLEYPVGDNGRNLSGGQLQRIEIARALIRKRPIILADEMTSALDEQTASAVRQTLLEIPCTLVEVSHRFTKEELKEYTQVWDVSQF